ncbi:hypothetical protein [Shouchella miscanthi]|uniref:hypothetical protein n=1 Tax=Shouchella miscanthi TaxID=2598861 RepID=UPI0011A51D40|nr:hypothetical protein [Shouchella miscanthi]
MTTNLKDSQVTAVLEINGEVHLLAMEQEHYEAVSTLVKMSATTAYPTGKSQTELREFLGINN